MFFNFHKIWGGSSPLLPFPLLRACFKKALKQSKKAENYNSSILLKFSHWVPLKLYLQLLAKLDFFHTPRPETSMKFRFSARPQENLPARARMGVATDQTFVLWGWGLGGCRSRCGKTSTFHISSFSGEGGGFGRRGGKNFSPVSQHAKWPFQLPPNNSIFQASLEPNTSQLNQQLVFPN